MVPKDIQGLCFPIAPLRQSSSDGPWSFPVSAASTGGHSLSLTLHPTRDSALAVSSSCSTLSVVTPLLDLQVLLWKSAAAVNALPICLPSLTCCHYQHNRLPPSTPVSSESVRAEAGSSAFPIPKCPGRSRDEEHVVRGGEDRCLDLCTPGAFDLDSCGG